MTDRPDIKIGQSQGSSWLTGQLLVAMPGMTDPRFEKTVSLVCSHGPDGAMALVLNRMFGELTLSGLVAQFQLSLAPDIADPPVFYGGPVEPVRGFVLHSASYKREGTNLVTETVSMTATVEILRDMCEGHGPDRTFVALGYAGWGPGQLDNELQSNGWLTAPMDEEIVFDSNLETKWVRALSRIGVSPSSLVGDIGHA